jgi:RHS repeat-associated protein
LPNKLIQSVTYTYTGLATSQRLDYTYFPDQRVKSLTWRNGTAVAATWNYGYDLAGRLNQLTNSFGETTQYLYDTEGKLTVQVNANGTRVEYGYNQQRGFVTSLTHKNGSVPFQSFGMTYDNGLNTVGNITGVSELTGGSVSYGYDALYRLTNENRTGATPYARTHGYDLAGNLTQVNGSAFATYDDANKIATLAGAGASAAYDADGNLLSVQGAGMLLSRFFYDGRDKVIRQTRGIQTVTYGYDASGTRVVSQSGTAPKKFYIFDGDTLIGEVGSSGVVSAVYTWGADGLVSERLPATSRSLWYHYGAQGETRNLTESSGAVVASYVYSAYGLVLQSVGSDPNPFKYGGKFGYYSEGPNGAILCSARWYSPNLQRWVNRDPSGYKGGDNLYRYCKNSPVRFVDPHGTESQEEQCRKFFGDDPTGQFCGAGNFAGGDKIKKFQDVINEGRDKIYKPCWWEWIPLLGRFICGCQDIQDSTTFIDNATDILKPTVTPTPTNTPSTGG